MNCILGMLLYKRLSDEFEEAREGVIAHYLAEGRSQAEAEQLASSKDEYDQRFFIPEKSRWSNLLELKQDLGSELYKSIGKIEEYNPSLEGVLVGVDFVTKNTLRGEVIQDLLSHFSRHRLRNEDLESPNLLGQACGALIERFAEDADRFGGACATPSELSQLLVALLKPSPGMHVYDPTVGSGGMLIEARKYLIEKGENPQNLYLFGQDMNPSAWVTCNINLLLHGVQNADIQVGNTLLMPKHTLGAELMSFDLVIAHPPFGLRNWGKDEASADIYGRYSHGVPSNRASAVELAFIQHMIASLNAEGKMGVVVPGHVLSSGGTDKDIRRGILEDDLVEAIIELPSSVLLGTKLGAYVLLFNKNKSSGRQNKILFIDTEKEHRNLKFRYKLREPDIRKIASTYEHWEVDGKSSTEITLDQIRSDDFNVLQPIRIIKSKQRIAKIDTDFKNYKTYRISDVATDIKALKEDMEIGHSDNDIFIPKVSISDVVSNRADTELKNQNLYIVSLDKNIVRSDYLKIFLNSELGKESREVMYSGKTIPFLPLAMVSNIALHIPSLPDQKKIVNAASNLSSIKAKINAIEKKLQSHPADDPQQKIIDNILSSITDLSFGVSPLLCDESIIHEFKASLRTPFPDYPKPSLTDGQERFVLGKKVFKSKKEIHTFLESIVLKTVASFLNARGGTLVIGVREYANNKEVVGIEREGFKSNDHYARHLIQILINAFGASVVSQFITVEIVKLEGVFVCVVRCSEETGDEFFYLEDVIYVRTGARIDKLTTKEVIELFKKRAKSSLIPNSRQP